MKLNTWQIDLKSFVIGLALAAMAFLLFAGSSTQAQSGNMQIQPGDGGVYVLLGNRVYWKSKEQCSSPGGC
ncbi:MAG TPA: hypothetical protein VJV03_14065 [Pyrinomonadaceae bacterium]|nr:hypothetical protein [Pyrinomonadaceae bacterium]